MCSEIDAKKWKNNFAKYCSKVNLLSPLKQKMLYLCLFLQSMNEGYHISYIVRRNRYYVILFLIYGCKPNILCFCFDAMKIQNGKIQWVGQHLLFMNKSILNSEVGYFCDRRLLTLTCFLWNDLFQAWNLNVLIQLQEFEMMERR